MEALRISEDGYSPLPAATYSVSDPCIKGVKILGRVSRNGRVYPDSVMAQAVKLYADAAINIDHLEEGQESRSFKDRFGWIENPRHVPGEGIYGDMRFNPEHPLAKPFVWWANQKPNKIGLSHDADVRADRKENGQLEIAEIHRVHGVDLVADSATTKGLLESLRIVREAMDMDATCDKQGKEIMEDLPDGAPAPDAAPADDWSQHLGQLILGILGDKSLDHASKKEKILGALKLVEDDKPAAEPEAQPEEQNALEDDGDAPAADDEGSASDEESEASDDDEEMAGKAVEALRRTGDRHYLALVKRYDELKVAEAKRRTLDEAQAACKKAGLADFAVTETFLSTLATSPKGEWERVLEDRRRVSTKFSTPKSSTPTTADDALAILRKKLQES